MGFIIWKQYGTKQRFRAELFSSKFPALLVTHLSFILFSAMFSGFWVLWWWDTNQNIHIYATLLLSATANYYGSFPAKLVKVFYYLSYLFF